MLTKILGGISVASVVALFIVFEVNAGLREDLGAAQLSIEQAKATNASNVAAIETVRQGLLACIDDRRVDETQNAVTVAQLQGDLETLRNRRQEVRVVREKIFRDPSCAELGAIDIAATCPALADSLLSSARSLSR